jgi:superfamily II DNA or RNA helicase
MQGWMDFMEGEVERAPKPYRPRPYQVEAKDRVKAHCQTTDKTALYIATGCGKTEIAALLCQEDWSGKGHLFITPRRELVRQSADRLTLRGVPCGIEMAEQRSDERTTVACYQSLQSRQRYRKFLGTVGLVIVDESHLNYSESALRMLAEFREWGAKVVGMTASPPKKKNVTLHEHYGDAAYVYDYGQAVADGYLVPCELSLCLLEDLDLSGFKASFGGEDPDFNQSRIARLMEKKAIVAGVGNMVAQYWEEKPSVVFCSSIQQAELVRDDLCGRGIHASIVHSQMDAEEQRLHLNDFMDGSSQVVINVGILTLGWDAPHVVNLFIARPTASGCLYIQMFGRGTRCLPGVIDGLDTVEERLAAIAASAKPHFRVFDITDASRHNDLKTALDVLRPNLDDRLMKRMRRRMQRGPVAPQELDAVIKAEAKALAAEQAAIDALEMRKRGNVYVGGTVVAYERDTFADAETHHRRKVHDVWWMTFGRFKGRGFKAIHAEAPWYLPYMLKKGVIKDEGLARNIRKFLSTR